MYSCPKCRSELKRVTSNGVTIEQCSSCGYWHNTATGEVLNFRVEGDSFIVRCPHCASRYRCFSIDSEKKINIGSSVVCPFCNGRFSIPEKPDPELYMEITCLRCSAKSRVLANKGKISIICPQCKGRIIHDTGIWPQKYSSAQQPSVNANTQNTVVNSRPVNNSGTRSQVSAPSQQPRINANTQNTQAHNQTKVSINECYQCPKCGWTHPNTSALNEITAKHTQCQSCGNSYLAHLTWED